MEEEPISISRSSFSHLRLLAGGSLITIVSDRLYTVGRNKRRCDIVLGGRCVSRTHCQLFLDGSDRKLRLVDGYFPPRGSNLGEVRGRFRSGSMMASEPSRRVSLNGVFVNGRRLERGVVFELSLGDEILLACRSGYGSCCGRIRYGFLVEGIVFSSANKVLDFIPAALSAVDSMPSRTRARRLLQHCTSIMQADNPVFYLRLCLDLDVGRRDASIENNVDVDTGKCSKLGDALIMAGLNNPKVSVVGTVEKGVCSDNLARGTDSLEQLEKDARISCYSDGRTFFLNRLEFMGKDTVDGHNVVSLPELLHPVGSLVRLFIATFTSDVPWFLSCCQLPSHLPVTIACHSTERCWSSSHDSRTSKPYSDYPNLLLVYPPFPDIIAFGKDRKRQGVACHHPKLFVLQREDSMRVVVTSANLVSKQWNNVTNTVWCQDFPRRSWPDYSSLFDTVEHSESDFTAQLAGFIASLILDVPCQAHWIAELTKFDFRGAAGHLVASVPGIHYRRSYSSGDHCLSAKQIMHLRSNPAEFVGSVHTSVVGLSHHFCTTADSTGAQLKTLASVLRKSQENANGLLEVLLRRNNNIPADVNAVSVLVADLDEFSEGDCIQLGFLPRDLAKWVSPLSDNGYFSFSAFIYPKEALAVALEGSSMKIQLILYVSQGPRFAEISRLIQPEHASLLCSLLASIQRCVGLWRLEEVSSEVLLRYKWPESSETDFVYASSSIGTSVNPHFLAAFSRAVGKRSYGFIESDESDPEWGCWSAKREAIKPSMRIIFPTIERVKNGACGILPSRYLLSLSEKTWQRLRANGIFCDAIPHPDERVGHPMHIKVARRRFQSRISMSSFGWVYCGSHNFSPAAWGHIIHLPAEARVPGTVPTNGLSPRLHICNYELGILLVVPPPNAADGDSLDLDKVVLPFVMPAPKYKYSDKPATAQAMREAVAEAAIMQKESSLAAWAIEEQINKDDLAEEEEISDSTDFVAVEGEEDKIYAEMLWSQVDSLES